MEGRGGSPGCPRCPGNVPDQTPPCVLLLSSFSGGESRGGGAGSAGPRGAEWGREAVGGQGGRERPLETLPESIRGAEGPCAPAEGGGLADIRRDEG